MNKKNFTIAISCIGSGVGQSVISSMRLSRLPVKTVGLGTNPFAYGAYDCDSHDITLSIHDKGYIDNLIEVCRKHGIDLLIPGLDDEVLVIAQNISRFDEAGIRVIISGEKLVSICRDKERMGRELSRFADVFVKTFDRATLEQDIATGRARLPLIAKPRGGFASRGIEIILNEDDFGRITDDHIIQEVALPGVNDPNYGFYMNQLSRKRNSQVAEISIQLVYGPDGRLMGRMSSYNKLNNGVPIEVIPYETDYVWSVVDKLTPALLEYGLKGPINIQGRLNDEGIKLFEMNPRFTGITGLRALMGFNEVEACVKEWLGIDKGENNLQLNYGRFGTRQTADKSISLDRNVDIQALFSQLNGKHKQYQKTVLITGAGGYLGQCLINRLIDDGTFRIWVYDREKSKCISLYGDRVEAVYDNADYLNGRIQLGNADILLHLGFTRPFGTNHDIADSLKFTHELFTRAATNQIPAIINISSQSVYGLESPPPWTEQTPVAPATVYAQAKYATELLLETLSRVNNVVKFSSIRLGTLAGGSGGLIETDFLSKFVRRACQGDPINIIGGMQKMERFDVRDAADAIITMLKTAPEKWKPVYNLSSGEVWSLKELAEKSVRISSGLNGYRVSEIIVEDRQVTMEFGMDSTLFWEDMNWKPKFNIDQTIESLAEYFSKAEVNQLKGNK